MSIQETWKEEFEKRDDGKRGEIGLQNPATNWQKITAEVASLDNRMNGLGYMKYAQRRVFFGETHEAAAEYAANIR
jgi:hypothetical protein